MTFLDRIMNRVSPYAWTGYMAARWALWLMLISMGTVLLIASFHPGPFPEDAAVHIAGLYFWLLLSIVASFFWLGFVVAAVADAYRRWRLERLRPTQADLPDGDAP